MKNINSTSLYNFIFLLLLTLNASAQNQANIPPTMPVVSNPEVSTASEAGSTQGAGSERLPKEQELIVKSKEASYLDTTDKFTINCKLSRKNNYSTCIPKDSLMANNIMPIDLCNIVNIHTCL